MDTTTITFESDLATALHAVSAVCPKKATYAVPENLTAVYFWRSEGYMKAVATDKARLVRFTIPSQGEDFGPMSLTRSVLDDVAKAVKKAKPRPSDKVTMAVGEQATTFTIPVTRGYEDTVLVKTMTHEPPVPVKDMVGVEAREVQEVGARFNHQSIALWGEVSKRLGKVALDFSSLHSLGITTVHLYGGTLEIFTMPVRVKGAVK